jgi:4-amino-4-deoxy-L-arabinose transferase-like glycosyltransferase
MLAGVLVALPWYVAVAAETKGEFLREFFLRHNAGRFGATMEGHGGPWFYYPICLIVGLAPWSVFLGPTIAYALGRRARADNTHRTDTKESVTLAPGYRFLWCWIAVYVLFFSASATKLPNYVLPVYPPLAVLTARFLDRWRLHAISPPGWLMNVSLACLTLVGIAVSAGLAFAGGWLDVPFLRGRQLPGLEAWAFVGIIPVVGAGIGWWCVRQKHRHGLIACMAATAALFVGVLAAGGAVAVDGHKAARPLASLLPPDRNEREIRIGCYGYYQPSLVFYSRREVTRIATEAHALANSCAVAQSRWLLPRPIPSPRLRFRLS